MKRISFLLVICFSLEANAQSYSISFLGTGESLTVNSVKVENLTKGTSLTLLEGDILHLSGTVGISQDQNNNSSGIKIYPNPMFDQSTVEIIPQIAGDATISVYDITGKLVAQIQSYLENYLQKFRLSGVNRGFYLISVKGSNYQYSGKLLSNGEAAGRISIEKIHNNQTVDEKSLKIDSKGVQASVDMAYSTGNRLKFTGISGIYRTVITDIPSTDKTISFNFVACTDGDNNNYPVVVIGTQLWMAENLKTTRYSNGDQIPNVIADNTWNNLSTGAMCNNIYISNYSAIYGLLYNWYAVKDSRNICPLGWHVPADTAWTTLTTNLGGESIAGSKLKEKGTNHWMSPNSDATNESGFTALPSGSRGQYGFDIALDWGLWWSLSEYDVTEAWNRILFTYNANVNRVSNNKKNGFSVRCIKD